MDLSRFKIEVYDFLGLILPGLIAICELWIFVRGWDQAVHSLGNLSGTAFTILLVASFGVGHLIQELGDMIIKHRKGPRFFRQGRDKFWVSEEAKPLKEEIAEDLRHPVESADEAFDHCLTKIEGRFPKRDIFLATADLCRSLVVLAILAIFPLTRVVLIQTRTWLEFVLVFAASLSIILVACQLSWARMVRFRELAEVTVFRIYSASREQSKSRGT